MEHCVGGLIHRVIDACCSHNRGCCYVPGSRPPCCLAALQLPAVHCYREPLPDNSEAHLVHQSLDEYLNAALYMVVPLQGLAAETLKHSGVTSATNAAGMHRTKIFIETTVAKSSAHGSRCCYSKSTLLSVRKQHHVRGHVDHSKCDS